MATTVRKLIVEVVEARNLLPKDGHGTSSPYAIVDFDGQRRRTQTVRRDLNPMWNESLEFRFDAPSDDTLEIEVLHDRRISPSRRNNFLGRLRLNSSLFVRKGEEALMFFPLEKKSFFSWIRGEIGLRIYCFDVVVPPPSPPPPPPKVEEAPKVEEPPQEPATTDATPGGDSPPPPASDGAEVDKPNPATNADGPTPAAAEEGGAPPPPPAVETPPPPPPEAAPDDAKPPEEQTHPPPPEGEAGPPPAAENTAAPKQRAGDESLFQRRPGETYAPDLPGRFGREPSAYDLVEKMHYVFVRIVKARSLPGDARPVVKISVSGGSHARSGAARRTSAFEWDQTFAFRRDAPEAEAESTLEISVWDPQAGGDNFLGGVCFDVSEIPTRDPPDSPLAPQWYRLEGGGAHRGDLMLAAWIGTQADESFADAWKTDTKGSANSRSKVYLSPKLWYLRATILEAQDVMPFKESSFSIRVQLGFQNLKTRYTTNRNGSPSWNEDLIFVAGEPFTDHHLVFSLETRHGKEITVLGTAEVPLISIERRVDDRKVVSRWFELENNGYSGRLHVRLCFDGGYHVSDEPVHLSSDFRPSARQLWKPPIGMVELGILGCQNLLPVKTVAGKGTADVYAVAKYGDKWVRTRTVTNSLDPKWNEQHTWQVYDPCTVLTVGIFDSMDESKDTTRQDFRIGKIRIRISTLESNRVYRSSYPLLLLLPNTGLKKMGEVEIAVRFVRATSSFEMVHLYAQSMLPRMHHLKPIGVAQQEVLRQMAVRVLVHHLSRAEPPLRREVVVQMLDVDVHAFSMRRVRANWLRIWGVAVRVVEMARWVEDTRTWKKPTSTIIVHVLVVLLVWHPDLVVPTLALYAFAAGSWNRRRRAKGLALHPCPKLSQVESVDKDDLDEEFDTMPSSRAPEVVRTRYDRLRSLGSRAQGILGDLATQGEMVQALVTWRDPRATGIFIGLCFLISVALYMVPWKMVAVAGGFYYLRHPLFRDRMPSPVVNFFKRLPSLADHMM